MREKSIAGQGDENGLRGVLRTLLLPLALGLATVCGALTPTGAAGQRGAIQDLDALSSRAPYAQSPTAAALSREDAERVRSPETPTLLLTFFDVGQGDAVLIRSPSGQSVLYDGGRGGRNLAYQLRALGVSSLDLVIASHNHADHIGGLPEVIQAFRPRYVMENGIPHTTGAYRRFLQSIQAAGSQLLEPNRRVIGLGEAELHILPPQGAGTQNDNSIGVILTYGKFRASLTGDAEPALFSWWLANHGDLLQPVHVHKASHHGSRNGDTRAGIQALRPEVVVIGVSTRNSYGHPHGSALELYHSVGATVYRTDRHGSVQIEAMPSGQYRVETGRSFHAAPLPPRGPPAAAQEAVAPQQARPGCVDLNRASTEELQRIVHIGSRRAGQILRLRQEHPFRSVGELTRVRGIGPVRAQDIEDEGVACVR